MEPSSPSLSSASEHQWLLSGHEDQHSTPGTSPDSPSIRTPDRNKHHLSPKAAQFVENLDNYLPVGCAILPIHNCSSFSYEWTEIQRLPEEPYSVPTFAYNLERLVEARLMRMYGRQSEPIASHLIVRLYMLPHDVGNSFIDRRDSRLCAALQTILPALNVCRETWQGNYVPDERKSFDRWATKDEGSLFHMFNTLPSPRPSTNNIREIYAKEALEDLLDPHSILPGLKTVLYPYQRRSAGLMLQREAVVAPILDPRLDMRTAPDGSTFYYGAKDLLFLRHPAYIDSCRGGILAETMGLGKTVMLLALILATKDHLPQIPPEYNTVPTRPRVGSLLEIAISNINRKSVPWKVEFARIKATTGNEMTSCIAKLEASPPTYEIPQEPRRWGRKTTMPPPKVLTLAATTIIVVPRNLCKQWQSELQKHVEDGALKVLVMEDTKRALPLPDELRTYDIVLFTRNRFELEIKDGSDEQGQRLLNTQLVCRCPYGGSTRVRDCRCVRNNDLYNSPLKHLHFRRLIIDEGHFFSNSNNNAVAVANKLITVDSRWVVSGTPAKDLLGVEVDLSSSETMPHHKSAFDDHRSALLEQRRSFNRTEDTTGAIKSLGALASGFLKIRPWYALQVGERKEAEWDDYIYRHEDPRRRTYSGFSTCLRRTLEAMVVKTQPADVEKDIELPSLSHEVVRLEPSYFDKVTANLFTLVLTANAVTSERTDADYLFHKHSAKDRYHLISNLRQSAFFWTGFSNDDVKASIKNSEGYLAKQDTNCTHADRQLLESMLTSAKQFRKSEGWKAMSRSHELGIFVEDWPSESAEHWSFDDLASPLLTGISQVLEAQKHVNERAGTEDPGEGLAGAGIHALAPARFGSEPQDSPNGKKQAKKPILTKAGLPTSSLDGEPLLKRRLSGSKPSPTKSPRNTTAVPKQKGIKRSKSSPANTAATPLDNQTVTASRDRPLKRRHSEVEAISYAPHSPYLRSTIIGTTSAKLSYLLSQITAYHRAEKILVFYEGDNIAWYIAQSLELLHIKHEIYAKSLAAALKSEYVVHFDQGTECRVLLMDVKQAAFGLNLSSASRIYFVNPVCRPGVEAQAIKRAHRIGQTRSVVVETLVLRGSIEEEMLERSRRMTRREHRDARVLEDDGGMREIIQRARMLDIGDGERQGYGRLARLEVPQQLWGREGWRDTVVDSVLRTAPAQQRRELKAVEITTPTKKRRITFEDVTRADEEDVSIEDEDAFPSSAPTRLRTLSFVDCTANEQKSQVVDNSDSQPVSAQSPQRAEKRAETPAPELAGGGCGFDGLADRVAGGGVVGSGR
ncbi:hypothetical protein LTR62_004481 [Meristemomyces frigidus]|uniref:Helicase ATP-binding domain-containing protein n=1 Tax=Meristemomyces frigidus TaxID=1508187 RepID=A0AAN7THD4_9PEZI|nr:hypothetical protein LTR62_004481 [Meristemomyces frigidus]